MKATIVIANYNNSNFLKECINSLISQTYKNIEIIFFDDNSSDDSLNVVKNFNKVKIIENKVQTPFGSLNQINAFKKGIAISTGDIIFFLDSDDFFKIDKVEKVINFFLKHENKKIVFDFPTVLRGTTKLDIKRKKNLLNTYWGYIHPTSCISIRRKFVNEVFNKTINDSFTDTWLDFRLLLFSKYLDEYDVIDENLTFYRQSNSNVSSKFKKFKKSWWKRRNEAHDYFFQFIKKNNVQVAKNLDFYITKYINKLIK